MPDGVWVYGDAQREHRPLPAPAVPRYEVIDELHAAIVMSAAPLHDGAWARRRSRSVWLRSNRRDSIVMSKSPSDTIQTLDQLKPYRLVEIHS